MKIERFQAGPILENCYFIYQKKGGACFVIDPGYQARRCMDIVCGLGVTPAGILLTHRHSDHAGQVRKLRDVWACPVYMHEADAYVSDVPVDVRLEHGSTLDLEGETIEVLHTPGHTEGSVCFLARKSGVCFTGDTIFDTDLGRTDLPGGSEEQLVRSIRNVLDPALSNGIRIFPGHEEGCTMKEVRKNNMEYRDILAGKERNQIW